MLRSAGRRNWKKRIKIMPQRQCLPTSNDKNTTIFRYLIITAASAALLGTTFGAVPRIRVSENHRFLVRENGRPFLKTKTLFGFWAATGE